jgi:hypothetical protein
MFASGSVRRSAALGDEGVPILSAAAAESEDSLVRALWAGQALVWQIYPQDDGVHHSKLAAFLRALGAPPTLVDIHRAWNADSAQSPPMLRKADLQAWGQWVRGVRQSLLAQPDLAQQLTAFAEAKRGAPSP